VIEPEVMELSGANSSTPANPLCGYRQEMSWQSAVGRKKVLSTWIYSEGGKGYRLSSTSPVNLLTVPRRYATAGNGLSRWLNSVIPCLLSLALPLEGLDFLCCEGASAAASSLRVHPPCQ